MKNKVELIVFFFALAFFVGCGSMSPLHAMRHAAAQKVEAQAKVQAAAIEAGTVSPDDVDTQSGVDASPGELAPVARHAAPVKVTVARIPATRAAKTSPVAAAVSHIVHWMELAGACCLVASGLLIYFGQIIPGVKVGIAAIALPVSAVWFNYHYGEVIAGILISSAVGFLWAVNKKHPEYLAAAENKFSAEYHSLRGEFAAELGKLRSEFIPKGSQVVTKMGAAV